MVSSDATGSLEFPVMLHTKDAAPAMGIIERLTASDARIRSLAVFPAGALVEFELVVHGGARASVSGMVTETSELSPRRFYTLQLHELPPAERDALARAVAELQMKRASTQPVTDAGGLVRASVRAPADFSVGYAIERGGFGTGHVRNISTGGMLMTAAERLDVGATLELSFTIDRGVSRKEIVVTGRIVAHQQRPVGVWAHHIAFFNVDPKTRWEIATYVERYEQ